MKLLKERLLVFLIAFGGLAVIVGYILWLAKADSQAPDNPFIYDL